VANWRRERDANGALTPDAASGLSAAVAREHARDQRFPRGLTTSASSESLSSLGSDLVAFRNEYWGAQSGLDLEFLDELDAVGARAPKLMTATLVDAFAGTNDIDAQRVFAARALGEMVQGIDTYAILAMAVRDRAQRGILETFVLHSQAAPAAALDDMATLETPDDLLKFLNIDPETLDQQQRGSLPALFRAGNGLARIMGMKGGVVRTFYNKSKHGPILVRSVREGRPAFGPAADPTVFVIARNRAEDASDANFWNAIGVPVTKEFIVFMQDGGTLVNLALTHLIAWVRLGLEHRRL
jgi:hypothetical protein